MADVPCAEQPTVWVIRETRKERERTKRGTEKRRKGEREFNGELERE